MLGLLTPGAVEARDRVRAAVFALTLRACNSRCPMRGRKGKGALGT
jgi:hypothetical protein